MIHAEIDPRRCCGYRLCADAAPEIFVINSAGKAESLLGDIPLALEGVARAAAQECPSGAISIRAAEPPK